MDRSSVSVLISILLMTISVYSMQESDVICSSKELVSHNDYGSLSAHALDTIYEQKQELLSTIVGPVQTYLDKFYTALALDQIYTKFCALSESDKHNTLNKMSLPLLYLHVIALCLPQEIVKNHIVLALLDGNQRAVEKFYSVHFMQAFDLYYDIKTRLADDTKPIGDLYVESEMVQDLVLRMQKKTWYLPVPLVNYEDNEAIQSLLSDDIKNLYLGGKTILVLPDDEYNSCTQSELCGNVLVASGLGAGLFGCMSVITMVAGSCDASTVLFDLCISGGCGTSCYCLCCAFQKSKMLWDYIERVTL